MKKICALCVTLILVTGLAVSPVFAGGGKVRGDNGEGPVEQNFCGPDDVDDCPVYAPYWWE
jgi:hypothetical protein